MHDMNTICAERLKAVEESTKSAHIRLNEQAETIKELVNDSKDLVKLIMSIEGTIKQMATISEQNDKKFEELLKEIKELKTENITRKDEIAKVSQQPVKILLMYLDHGFKYVILAVIGWILLKVGVKP